MTTTSNKRTAEERKAQAEALHTTLIGQVRHLSDSGRRQDKGRQVRRGEASIKIFGYSTKTTTGAEDKEGSGEEQDRMVRFFPRASRVRHRPDRRRNTHAKQPSPATHRCRRPRPPPPATAHLASSGWTLSRPVHMRTVFTELGREQRRRLRSPSLAVDVGTPGMRREISRTR